MAYVDPTVRGHLGLSYNPDPTSVRGAVLRSANVDPPDLLDPSQGGGMVRQAADELGGLNLDPTPVAIREVTDNLVGALHTYLAPAVLAVIAPNHEIQESASGVHLDPGAKPRFGRPAGLLLAGGGPVERRGDSMTGCPMTDFHPTWRRLRAHIPKTICPLSRLDTGRRWFCSVVCLAQFAYC